MANKQYICYVGRPSYQKNTFFFVDVAKKVYELCPDLEFKLLGVGYYSPDLENLKKKIHDYGLENVIELLPWLSHNKTLEYIDGALLYLTVSRYEGLPLAVIEAMSLKKAIIASDVLGNKDCVQNGENGFLLPINVDAFAKAILTLYKDCDLRKKFEQNSRRIFENNFCIEKQISKLQKIYRTIGNTD